MPPDSSLVLRSTTPMVSDSDVSKFSAEDQLSSDGWSTVLASIRKQGPFALLGLGGAITIIWIVLLAWMPLSLIYSVISVALRQISVI